MVFDDIIEDEKHRLLDPLIDPKEVRNETILSGIKTISFVILAASLYFAAIYYLDTGTWIFPWWALLVLGGILSTTVLLDDDANDLGLEITEYRESEAELYSEIDNDLEQLLGERELNGE